MFCPSEQLESRRLLSIALNFDYSTGLFSVMGRSSNDDIRVTVVGENQAAPGAKGQAPELRAGPVLPGVSVYENGTLIFNSNEIAAPGFQVKSVELYGNAGNDVLNIWTYQTEVDSMIRGGAGDDTVYATTSGFAYTPRAFGDDGNDVVQTITTAGGIATPVYGGAGDDQMLVLRTYGDVGRNAGIFGGDGDDFIETFAENSDDGAMVMAGEGNDTIYGTSKNDLLFGDEGNDFIEAEDGNDYVNGGLGDDWICGDEGDDFLDHGGGADTVDGGEGRDTGVAGKDDTWIDVENLILE
jgi:Ca2+-binding RTX toxin-like protein